ncbi:hypothetical protein [Curtobacterium flaccumfaciens]|uniref:hypothetical protein n=1 Tax=Curtobacterium flaccumfaciens TaxID=2035 RepID=UPI001BE0F7AD|nr:hypothetical protein [Curtobacterium flaccumfaciens]MBT1586157.1 hypothetical protein [Curtobacterium flaccumfaciens pv. flaccumfaciens]MCX2799589.1 hypothetical protein [Curtobacterium flaccumfaciens pv. flaccumfaciens]
MTEAEPTNAEPTGVDLRWAESEERARAVSAQSPGAVLQVRWFVMAIVLVLVALGVGASVLPAGSDARFALSAVVAAGGFVAGISEAVQLGIRRRRNGVGARPAPVLAPLQQREQRAVTAAATGRRAAPADRLAIVRARAVELADGTGLQLTAGLVVVWAAVTFSGVTLWPVYLAGGIAAGQFAWTARSAVRARRYLDVHPVHLRNPDARSGHGETPSGSIESRT